MTERPGRKPRTVHSAEVLRTERLTPHMHRVVLGGAGLAAFSAGACSDHYVKLLFTPPGVTYPEPFDLERVRAEYPRAQWPSMRTYTVRYWDPERRELTLDFVIHGDEGLAGPWALAARPGDTIRFLGPGGAYLPKPDADWHLLVGDESALPAIARSLELLPTGAKAYAYIEIPGPEEEQRIDTDAEVVWLHRDGRRVGEALIETVRALTFPEGRLQAFVHGEAHFVKDLRRLLRVELGVPREDLSISGYWRQGHTEDAWQASKREWNARIEAEQEQDTPTAA